MADNLPEPESRNELFLAGAAGESVTLPTPASREELFLAKAAGEEVTTPTPQSRKELFLNAIAEGGGGGGGDITPEFFGCDEGKAEMEYLENIMPEILTINYGGINSTWL